MIRCAVFAQFDQHRVGKSWQKLLEDLVADFSRKVEELRHDLDNREMLEPVQDFKDDVNCGISLAFVPQGFQIYLSSLWSGASK